MRLTSTGICSSPACAIAQGADLTPAPARRRGGCHAAEYGHANEAVWAKTRRPLLLPEQQNPAEHRSHEPDRRIVNGKGTRRVHQRGARRTKARTASAALSAGKPLGSPTATRTPGDWHRQVSLLSADGGRRVQRARRGCAPLARSGKISWSRASTSARLPVGTLLRCGDVLLEADANRQGLPPPLRHLTKRWADCIMPREGVFARVLEGGQIYNAGDEMTVQPRAPRPYHMQAAVVTLSDRCASGEREDKSGPLVARTAGTRPDIVVVEQLVRPDERELLERKPLSACADQRQLDLILTTGGTGFAPRDITPEATLDAVAERRRARHRGGHPRRQSCASPRAPCSRRAAAVIRGRDADHQSARQPQGLHGVHGRFSGPASARARTSARRADGLRPLTFASTAP